MGLSGKTSHRWDNRKMDMSIYLFNGFLMLGFVVATVPDVMVLGSSGSTLVMEPDIPLKKCRYSRAYSMIQVRCTNLGLNEIPTDLKSDIQILDASVNRIRELSNESLAPYKNLEYLYLGDNFIQNIQEAAFKNQHYLQVLDLSTNGVDDLPKNLFQLPYLRRLYLTDNKFTDNVFHVDVKSPLDFLQLSKNKLCRIPSTGPVPTLTQLNVSDNFIATVTPEDLAPFCSLKVLDLSKNPIKFDAAACECQVLNAWLNTHGVRSIPVFNCTEEQNCSTVEFTNRTSELFDKCSNIMKLQIETKKARNTWILVACCVSAFISCLFVGLFCVHNRNKKRRKRLKKEQRIAATNANTELLNSNLNHPENT